MTRHLRAIAVPETPGRALPVPAMGHSGWLPPGRWDVEVDFKHIGPGPFDTELTLSFFVVLEHEGEVNRVLGGQVPISEDAAHIRNSWLYLANRAWVGWSLMGDIGRDEFPKEGGTR
jgi:hypothetical protein